MNEAEVILKLIREVDQSDIKKLDEIDARVWFWLNNITFVKPIITTVPALGTRPEKVVHRGWRTKEYGDVGSSLYIKRKPEEKPWKGGYSHRYTRSRDALKTIRPEGWAIDSSMASTGCDATCYMYFMVNGNEVFGTDSFSSETEELAELYAIIQAIEYERTKT